MDILCKYFQNKDRNEKTKAYSKHFENNFVLVMKSKWGYFENDLAFNCLGAFHFVFIVKTFAK